MKFTTARIKDLAGADAALHRIAVSETRIREAELKRDRIIQEANATAESYTASLKAEIEAEIEQLRAYAEKNRDTILAPGKKTVTLGSGTLGWRMGKAGVEVSEDTADMLIAAGLENLVKVTKKPVASALLNMEESELAKYNAKKIPAKESFYVLASKFKAVETD